MSDNKSTDNESHVDKLESSQRSRNMSAVKSKNTRPELIVRRFLHSKGFRYSLHYKKLPGRPDITLVRHRVAIFINGCFWHGHKNCRYATIPKTNRSFWADKIEKNILRDSKTLKRIKELEWHTIKIWTCDLKNKTSRNRRLSRLLSQVNQLIDKNIKTKVRNPS